MQTLSHTEVHNQCSLEEIKNKTKQPTNQTNKNMHSYADVSAIWITVIKYGEEAVSAFQVYSMPVQLA